MNKNTTIIKDSLSLFQLARRLNCGIGPLLTLHLISRGCTRPGDILKFVGEDSSSAAITGYGDCLEKRNLVTRRNGSGDAGEDRRGVFYALTEEGVEVVNEFESCFQA